MEKRRIEDGTVLVGFQLPAAVSASSVTVCGDFNGWEPGAHPLSRLGDGSFRTEIALPPGARWRFRYLLDGHRWENDWAADDYVPNGLGEDDSVVDLTVVPGGAGSPSGTGEHGAAQGAPADGGLRPGTLRRWWRRMTRRPDDEAVPAGS